jgi:hypothetical protein
VLRCSNVAISFELIPKGNSSEGKAIGVGIIAKSRWLPALIPQVVRPCAYGLASKRRCFDTGPQGNNRGTQAGKHRSMNFALFSLSLFCKGIHI